MPVNASPPAHLVDRLESGERLLWWGLPDTEKLAVNHLVPLACLSHLCPYRAIGDH
jgi:hypothetical protein